MFSQQKNPKQQFTLGLPLDVKSKGNAKDGKPLSPAEQYEQAMVTAQVFVDGNNARVQRELDKHKAVADNNYWFYGYFGANMCATMAACLAIGSRIPFFRSYSGWIAVTGGYLGGKACMAFHSQYLLANVIKEVDHAISEAKRMDEQTNSIVPLYQREVEHLTRIKYEIMPTLPEAIAARGAHKELTLDDKADALIEAYQKRKEATGKK